MEVKYPERFGKVHSKAVRCFLLTVSPSHLNQRRTTSNKIFLYESTGDTLSQGLRKIWAPSQTMEHDRGTVPAEKSTALNQISYLVFIGIGLWLWPFGVEQYSNACSGYLHYNFSRRQQIFILQTKIARSADERNQSSFKGYSVGILIQVLQQFKKRATSFSSALEYHWRCLRLHNTYMLHVNVPGLGY